MARAMINIYFGVLTPGPKVSHAMVVQFFSGNPDKGRPSSSCREHP